MSTGFPLQGFISYETQPPPLPSFSPNECSIYFLKAPEGEASERSWQPCGTNLPGATLQEQVRCNLVHATPDWCMWVGQASLHHRNPKHFLIMFHDTKNHYPWDAGIAQWLLAARLRTQLYPPLCCHCRRSRERREGRVGRNNHAEPATAFLGEKRTTGKHLLARKQGRHF